MNAEDKKVLKVISFNSMIVRLKGCGKILERDRVLRFQFYDSPIKSPIHHAGNGYGDRFQFYDSPIKRIVHTALP